MSEVHGPAEVEDLGNIFPWVVMLQFTKPSGVTSTHNISGVSEEFALEFAKVTAKEIGLPSLVFRINHEAKEEVLWQWDGNPETYDGPLWGRLT